MPTAPLISLVVIALSSNLDNVGVGAAYGARAIRVPWRSNLLIAAVSAASTGMAALLGERAYQFMSAATGQRLGAGVIVLAGLWVLRQERRLRRDLPAPPPSGGTHYGWEQLRDVVEHPEHADWDHSGSIDAHEAFALALGLSVNNLPNGVAAGMLGLDIGALCAAVLLGSLGCLWLGMRLGRLGQRWIGRIAGALAGWLLIGIGLFEGLG